MGLGVLARWYCLRETLLHVGSQTCRSSTAGTVKTCKILSSLNLVIVSGAAGLFGMILQSLLRACSAMATRTETSFVRIKERTVLTK